MACCYWKHLSPLGSVAGGSPDLQRKCRFMWCRMMFFFLGRAGSVSWSWWNLLCFIPFVGCACLDKASFLCLSGKEISHLIPACTELSCQMLSVCCNKVWLEKNPTAMRSKRREAFSALKRAGIFAKIKHSFFFSQSRDTEAFPDAVVQFRVVWPKAIFWRNPLWAEFGHYFYTNIVSFFTRRKPP